MIFGKFKSLKLAHDEKRLLGETMREIGALALVFVPLTTFLESKDDSHHLSLTFFFTLAGIALIGYGIKFEAKAGAELRRLDVAERREKNHDISISDVQSDLHRDDSSRPS